MRAKAAQEELIEAASIPYSIVRATQFFEFVAIIADAATEGDTVRVPAARIQPVAAQDVARAVEATAVGAPVNGVVEIAGLEAMSFEALIGASLTAREDARHVVAAPDARYFGAALDDAELLPGPDAALGATRFADWLSRPAIAG